MPSIGLAMIVKDEWDKLDICLSSTEGIFDQINIVANDNSEEYIKKALTSIAIKHNAHLTFNKWEDDFAKQRNVGWGQLTTDWVCWLDADDTMVNPRMLIDEVARADKDKNCGIIFMPYHYSHDEHGNCNLIQGRERVVRNSCGYKWVGALHEVLRSPKDYMAIRCNEKLYIRHNVDKLHIDDACSRNMRISKKEYDKEMAKEEPDPRTLYYYARALIGSNGGDKSIKEAIEVFKAYLDSSGWDEERYSAMDHMVKCMFITNDQLETKDWAWKMIQLRPQLPYGYFHLARFYMHIEDWAKCIQFTQIGGQCKVDESGIIAFNPLDYSFHPLHPLERAYRERSELEDAMQCCTEALKIKPKDPNWMQLANANFMARQEKEYIQASMKHFDRMKQEEPKKFRRSILAGVIPNYLDDCPQIIFEKNLVRSFDSKNRLVIYCGHSAETWGPYSAGKGIGGSEEMVINLAPELAKLGWNVQVYNETDRFIEKDGVQYFPYDNFDFSASYEALIIWRGHQYIDFLLDENVKGNNFFWAHDCQKERDWTEERLERVKKLFVLSKCHRNELPGIPDEKFEITRNGILTEHFDARVERNPLGCIYASAPDRGLDTLLRLWPRIVEKVPGAFLDIYYGFNKAYREAMKVDRMRAQKYNEVIGLVANLDPKTFKWHGMVSHEEIAKAYKANSLWLYPCWFEEISCISAMKAQAAGCVPVTTTAGALPETVQYGAQDFPWDIADKPEELDRYVDTVVEYLNDQKRMQKIRKEMIPWALGKYKMETLAKEWSEILGKK